MENRITPENLRSLEPNQIYVFESNLIGKHTRGLGKTALQWGAKWGKGNGVSGSTYAIPIKGNNLSYNLPLLEIKNYVNEFIKYTTLNSNKIFLVTKIGCNDFTPKQIAPFFKDAVLYENIFLPFDFWKILGTI
jgi:hypothetical protein